MIRLSLFTLRCQISRNAERDLRRTERWPFRKQDSQTKCGRVLRYHQKEPRRECFLVSSLSLCICYSAFLLPQNVLFFGGMQPRGRIFLALLYLIRLNSRSLNWCIFFSQCEKSRTALGFIIDYCKSMVICKPRSVDDGVNQSWTWWSLQLRNQPAYFLPLHAYLNYKNLFWKIDTKCVWQNPQRLTLYQYQQSILYKRDSAVKFANYISFANKRYSRI